MQKWRHVCFNAILLCFDMVKGTFGPKRCWGRARPCWSKNGAILDSTRPCSASTWFLPWRALNHVEAEQDCMEASMAPFCSKTAIKARKSPRRCKNDATLASTQFCSALTWLRARLGQNGVEAGRSHVEKERHLSGTGLISAMAVSDDIDYEVS